MSTSALDGYSLSAEPKGGLNALHIPDGWPTCRREQLPYQPAHGTAQQKPVIELELVLGEVKQKGTDKLRPVSLRQIPQGLLLLWTQLGILSDPTPNLGINQAPALDLHPLNDRENLSVVKYVGTTDDSTGRGPHDR